MTEPFDLINSVSGVNFSGLTLLYTLFFGVCLYFAFFYKDRATFQKNLVVETSKILFFGAYYFVFFYYLHSVIVSLVAPFSISLAAILFSLVSAIELSLAPLAYYHRAKKKLQNPEDMQPTTQKTFNFYAIIMGALIVFFFGIAIVYSLMHILWNSYGSFGSAFLVQFLDGVNILEKWGQLAIISILGVMFFELLNGDPISLPFIRSLKHKIFSKSIILPLIFIGSFVLALALILVTPIPLGQKSGFYSSQSTVDFYLESQNVVDRSSFSTNQSEVEFFSVLGITFSSNFTSSIAYGIVIIDDNETKFTGFQGALSIPPFKRAKITFHEQVKYSKGIDLTGKLTQNGSKYEFNISYTDYSKPYDLVANWNSLIVSLPQYDLNCTSLGGNNYFTYGLRNYDNQTGSGYVQVVPRTDTNDNRKVLIGFNSGAPTRNQTGRVQVILNCA